MRSHRKLFSLDDDCYQAATHSITDSILLSVKGDVARLHIVTGWTDMLKVALWTPGRPSYTDVVALIRRSCAIPEELNASRKDVDYIFRSLYNGRRVDVFRKVCRAAKSKAESKIRREELLVHCHLVGDAEAGIVASSL